MAVAVAFYAYPYNLRIYNLNGDILRNIELDYHYLYTDSFHDNAVQLASNDDGSIIVIASLEALVTITGDTQHYQRTGQGSPSYNVAAILNLHYEDGKFRLYALTGGPEVETANVHAQYLESIDGISWNVLIDFYYVDRINGRSVYDISYVVYNSGTYYLYADCSYPYEHCLLKTTDFVSYTPIKTQLGYIHSQFLVQGDYIWMGKYTHLVSNSLGQAAKIAIVDGSATYYDFTGMPSGYSYILALDDGPMEAADGTIYFNVFEEVGASDNAVPYYHNGSEFVRNATIYTTPSEGSDYAFRDRSNYGEYKLSSIGTKLFSFYYPASIAVLGPSNSYYLIEPDVQTYGATIINNFDDSNEFWTEEDQCVEATYEY
jgi:hypothetical protein